MFRSPGGKNKSLEWKLMMNLHDQDERHRAWFLKGSKTEVAGSRWQMACMVGKHCLCGAGLFLNEDSSLPASILVCLTGEPIHSPEGSTLSLESPQPGLGSQLLISPSGLRLWMHKRVFCRCYTGTFYSPEDPGASVCTGPASSLPKTLWSSSHFKSCWLFNTFPDHQVFFLSITKLFSLFCPSSLQQLWPRRLGAGGGQSQENNRIIT